MTETQLIDCVGGNQRYHEAWPYFVEDMKTRWYGVEPVRQAWAFFKAGWEACLGLGPDE